MSEFLVYNPTAAPKQGTQQLAPRPSSLDGKRIGLLHNAKVNADVYLYRIQELLAEKYPHATFIFRAKPTASKPMEPDVLEAMRQCDLVVNAFGD
ncbi:MAG: hypothetical protein KGJ86_11545 [Chloroflexota bacterium]|nr:hypothetical protein [Chloroflexota bacterium]